MDLDAIRNDKIKTAIDQAFSEVVELPNPEESEQLEELKQYFFQYLQDGRPTDMNTLAADFEDEDLEFLSGYLDLLIRIRDKVNKEMNTSHEMLQKGKIARESGLLQEIHETAPAIIYKPGSVWVKPEGKWTPDRKAIAREIEELHRKNDIAILPKKKQPAEWRVICSQLGEFRKDELIHMAWELDIGTYINPRWNKSKICETISKHMAVL